MKVEEIFDMVNNITRRVVTISGSLSILLLALTGMIIAAIAGFWLVVFALRVMGF
jgi:hypothetical protein